MVEARKIEIDTSPEHHVLTVAQLVERLIVAQVVVGSNPTSHPKCRGNSVVEYPSDERRVGGANPSRGTMWADSVNWKKRLFCKQKFRVRISVWSK